MALIEKVYSDHTGPIIYPIKTVFIFSTRSKYDKELSDLIIDTMPFEISLCNFTGHYKYKYVSPSSGKEQKGNLIIKDLLDEESRNIYNHPDVVHNCSVYEKVNTHISILVVDPRLLNFNRYHMISSQLSDRRFSTSSIVIFDYHNLPNSDNLFWINASNYFIRLEKFREFCYSTYMENIDIEKPNQFLAMEIGHYKTLNNEYYVEINIHPPFYSRHALCSQILYKTILMMIWHLQKYIRQKDVIRLITSKMFELHEFVPIPKGLITRLKLTTHSKRGDPRCY